ncbi:hypothetical protein WJX84_011632 [Apatococcus fuscideae]|uniref:Large ribosomal subunit protein uL13c n=1 Tax=Apatococcus fuscideae TaxID=2026836 RepID=A0AAW1SVK8_9CHLO
MATELRCQHSTACSLLLPARQALQNKPLPATRQRAAHREECRRVHCQAASTEGISIPSLGPDVWNKTYYPKGQDTLNRKKQWYIIDAEGQTLGRLATLAATHIRGKTSPTFSPSMDMGAYVIVINSEKVTVGGRKAEQKKYYRHSGTPGGLKTEAFQDLQKRIPQRIIEAAVKGMLPKGRLGRELFHHLKVFKGPQHPHEAQQPVNITATIDRKSHEMKGAVLAEGIN